MKKLLSIYIILAAVVMTSCGKDDTTPPPAAYTAEVEAGPGIAPWAGNGSAAAPFLLFSASNIKWLKGQTVEQTKGRYYKLTRDLDITTPIWTPFTTFAGNFDGNGRTISGKLTAPESRGSRFGFFGEARGVTIKNLNITAEIYAPNSSIVGAIVGLLENNRAEMGSITNCTNSGKITCLRVGGGIVGLINYNIPNDITNSTATLISNCINSGDIIAMITAAPHEKEINLGGITGRAYIVMDRPKPTANPNNKYIIDNCTNKGNIKSSLKKEKAAMGGIIGNPAPLYTTLEVKGCTNSGVVQCGTDADAITATTERGSSPYYVALICNENFLYGNGDFTDVIITN